MTLKASKTTKEFDKKYGLAIIKSKKKKIEYKLHRIHSFWSLGIADPFPDESTA
jgi:hypothetical protein